MLRPLPSYKLQYRGMHLAIVVGHGPQTKRVVVNCQSTGLVLKLASHNMPCGGSMLLYRPKGFLLPPCILLRQNYNRPQEFHRLGCMCSV